MRKTRIKLKADLLFGVIAILIATLLIAVLPTDKEARIYEDTLRLHILANSNSKQDQNLKLYIRNRLLEKYGSTLSTSKNISTAKDNVIDLLPLMHSDVEKWIRDKGFDYSVEMKVSQEWYPRREYEDFTLPQGRYNSLQVILGDGDGNNWWCVMFPPLCMNIATELSPKDDAAIHYSKEEIFLISGKEYNIKFKILELLSEAFAKNG